MNQIQLHAVIDENLTGLRLDQALAKIYPQYSRSLLQQWIEKGSVWVNHKTVTKSKARVFEGQLIEINAILEDQADWKPEYLPLNIIYEDESLLVINKPAGLVVHPGAGNPKSTLVNALLHYDENLKKIPRAGLIHRLDKDTSGLLLVARTLSAHQSLTHQMQLRKIHRTYIAIVAGHPRMTGTIDLPLGRHPTQRTKRAVLQQGGKIAITHFKLLEKFATHSYLEIELETGRTHQIRVHMAYINHPLLGDPLYGKPRQYPQINERLNAQINNFKRQALHAIKIAFTHPATKEQLIFEAPIPEDLQELLQNFHNF